ncbi:MAG: hypothetical protein IH984_09305 [Planctomycetes bacterium]|nr:hypothetical protein [Planctomycetota bacterium]
MKVQNVFGYYWFGTCVRYLQDAREGAIVGKVDREEGYLLYNLDMFFESIKEFDLQVTNRASWDLWNILEEMKTKDPDTTLTEDEAKALRKAITNTRNTLEAEIKGLEAYVVTPKRLDVKRLMDDPGSLLAPKVFGKLPSIAQFDLAEAAKCIAFERPTAAAFHILRATEDVLRDFYKTLARQKRVKLMWGLMVSDLKKRKKAEKHQVLLAHLDHIRLAFRNPTQHPEATYDIHEVQDLWGGCVEAINRMAKVL